MCASLHVPNFPDQYSVQCVSTNYEPNIFGITNQFYSNSEKLYILQKIKLNICICTWCVQVLRSPKEAFAAAMQSRRESCEKCVCLQGDYIEK